MSVFAHLLRTPDAHFHSKLRVVGSVPVRMLHLLEDGTSAPFTLGIVIS